MPTPLLPYESEALILLRHTQSGACCRQFAPLRPAIVIRFSVKNHLLVHIVETIKPATQTPIVGPQQIAMQFHIAHSQISFTRDYKFPSHTQLIISVTKLQKIAHFLTKNSKRPYCTPWYGIFDNFLFSSHLFDYHLINHSNTISIRKNENFCYGKIWWVK